MRSSDYHDFHDHCKGFLDTVSFGSSLLFWMSSIVLDWFTRLGGFGYSVMLTFPFFFPFFFFENERASEI
jgi:hypothetical protein